MLAALGGAGSDRVTVGDVYGHGNQKDVTHTWHGREILVEYLPKTLLMLVVHDAQLEHVEETICDVAATGGRRRRQYRGLDGGGDGADQVRGAGPVRGVMV